MFALLLLSACHAAMLGVASGVAAMYCRFLYLEIVGLMTGVSEQCTGCCTRRVWVPVRGASV